MLQPEFIFNAAKDRSVKIGIGSLPGSKKVEVSAARANSLGYGMTEIYHDPRQLIEHLRGGRIDAAVRGDMDSHIIMDAIKKEFSLDHISRAALLQPRGGGMFLLAPVGIDEGDTIEQKLELARLSAKMIARLGGTAKVGIMSGGRQTDTGRSENVDRSIHDAADIVKKLRGEGLDVRDVQILIEDAIKDRNIIIAPDGISGNLIFRCLHLVDGGQSMGAPVLNLDRVFIDTSRAKMDYVDSIAFAAALTGRGI